MKKIILSLFLAMVVMLQPAASMTKVYAANDEYIIDDNSYNLDTYLGWSNNASIIKVNANLTGVGTTTIGSDVEQLLGWAKNFFEDKAMQRTIRDVRGGTMKFGANSNVLVRNITFDIDSGLLIEEGANVVFESCIFSQTVTNNGTATFTNCTFDTGKIENNGSAIYAGTTIEPENIGNAKPSFIPLNLTMLSTSLKDGVKGQAYYDSLSYELTGTNSDQASLEISILPNTNGLEASVVDNKIEITGTPVNTGDYTVNIKTISDDERDVSIEKTVPLKINDKLSLTLEGSLDAVTVGQTGYQCYLTPYVIEGTDKLDYYNYQNKHSGAKLSVSISPEGSGMNVININGTIAVSGTPEKAGVYTVQATLTDRGQTVVSNQCQLRIYVDDQTLQQRFDALDPTITSWDMEPYEISKCADSIVPVNLTNIYGSHESGLYGIIGNNQGYALETLTIPAGCSVTIENMKIYSSVKIIVEKGGSLHLKDSVAFGPVEVNGGTFTMSHSSALTDTLTLNEGSVLKDAQIISNSRYLTDGANKPDNLNVVIVNGRVTVSGTNTIQGDDGSGTLPGQNAILVNGELIIEENAILTATGGGEDIFYPSVQGGNGVVLNGGIISGLGTLIANGGYGHYGDGGDGITGYGKITVANLESNGGDSLALSPNDRKKGGDAVGEKIIVTTKNVKLTGGSGIPSGTAKITLTTDPDSIKPDLKPAPELDNNEPGTTVSGASNNRLGDLLDNQNAAVKTGDDLGLCSYVIALCVSSILLKKKFLKTN